MPIGSDPARDSSEQAYRVFVTREDGQWLADVPGLEGTHTHARTLRALDRAVREAVVLGADLPSDALDHLVLDYDYRSGDPQLDADADAAAPRRRRRRAELTGLADEVEERTRELGSRGVKAGLSVPDVAVLLGVSRQTRRAGRLARGQPGDRSAGRGVGRCFGRHLEVAQVALPGR